MMEEISTSQAPREMTAEISRDYLASGAGFPT